MRAAEAKSTEECPVKMKLVAPPLYVLTTNVSASPSLSSTIFMLRTLFALRYCSWDKAIFI
jgi:hypothetical protein